MDVYHEVMSKMVLPHSAVPRKQDKGLAGKPGRSVLEAAGSSPPPGWHPGPRHRVGFFMGINHVLSTVQRAGKLLSLRLK